LAKRRILAEFLGHPWYTFRQFLNLALCHKLPDLCVTVHRDKFGGDLDQDIDVHGAVRLRVSVEGVDDQLAPALRSVPPRGEKWLHEIKFDGWRIQVHKYGGSAAAFTGRLKSRNPHASQAVHYQTHPEAQARIGDCGRSRVSLLEKIATRRSAPARAGLAQRLSHEC
jgi:hypothetical protein